ncbi:MAG: ABC transporter ATP-binding protein [Candidatus Riflebacteria bacterium]|nr:ABC transporter ATP-binding protein [Candidatus Riflebacteria bacterium]
MRLSIGNLVIKFNDNPFLGPIEAVFDSGCLNLIVGRSGCGKSTLLKLIAGFHKDFTGAVSLDEDYFEPEGNVALAFQNPESLFFNSSVFEEIAYSLSVSGDNKDSIKNHTESWMKKWGLDPELYSNKYPYKLSGGEKRRVALAACTILSPKIILLDEPLAGLDRVGQSDLAEIIYSLSQEHIVIVVTHEPELLMQKDSRILYLNDKDTAQYSSSEFLSKAVIDNDFYPLPEWYSSTLRSYAQFYDLPMVNAEAVAEYLESYNNESASGN